MSLAIRARSIVRLFALVLLLVIIFEGCIQEKATNVSEKTPTIESPTISGQKIAKIKDYKITGDTSGPYILVNVSFEKLPITVYLLDEYGGVLDSKTIKNIRELPVKLYLGGHVNIFNESDIIRIVYNGQIVDEMRVPIHGPKVEILKVYNWYFDRFGKGCLLKDVRIIVKNDGDAPAYVESIKLIKSDTKLISWVSMHEYPILPNETKTLSASAEFYKIVNNQGTLVALPKGLLLDNATLQLIGPKGEILASTIVSLEVKC